MAEKGLVSSMEVGLMIVSESEKAFGDKPPQSFGETKREEMELEGFPEGEPKIDELPVIRVRLLSTATYVLQTWHCWNRREREETADRNKKQILRILE